MGLSVKWHWVGERGAGGTSQPLTPGTPTLTLARSRGRTMSPNLANPACGACLPGGSQNGPGSPGLASGCPPRTTCPCGPSIYSSLGPDLSLQVSEVLAQCTPHVSLPEPLCMRSLPLHSGLGLTPEEEGGCPKDQALCLVDRRRRWSSWERVGSAQPSTMA